MPHSAGTLGMQRSAQPAHTARSLAAAARQIVATGTTGTTACYTVGSLAATQTVYVHHLIRMGCGLLPSCFLACAQTATAVPVEPGSMLWVIQRDFLQGKSVQQLVNDALAPVPNPNKDKAIADTNAIRSSLTSIARNSTGYR